MPGFLLPLLLLLLLFFSVTGQTAYAATETYPNCPTYNCSGVIISYPFYLYPLGNIYSNRYCGYPDFGINCSITAGGYDRPVIHLPGDDYYVERIDYDNRAFTLIDDATAADSSTVCPRVNHGIDLGGLPLNLSTVNVNLTFHFNCTQLPSFATPIPCLSSGNYQSCVYIEGNERGNFDWETNCQDEVVTPVLEMAVNRLGSLAAYGRALSEGFELNWRNLEGCSKCDGRCGYSMETGEPEFICFCSDGRTTAGSCFGEPIINLKRKLIIGVVAALIGSGLICCVYCCCRMPKNILKSRCMNKNDRTIEDFIEEYGSLTPKRYNYFQIKKITKSFQVKLGQGGFGSVFKGKLSDGRVVAVKLLNSSKANGEEFVNEVASIGRTSHVNVVALLGFCYEGKKRALIYEFMPNGSLDKFICNNVPLGTAQPLTVNKLYEVALGIARGLEYLHRGCSTRILHLDIKPHNILLDEDFCPKIADFGLAKLHSRKDSIVSMLEARGTIGYIAPEVFSRNFGGVSHKSDVYSYGMMILEMVGGRKNVNARIDHSSDKYFPHWIYKRLEEDRLGLEGLGTVEENELVRKMILVGLWCIQTDPSRRPPMNKVIEMLQGSIDAITIPPKPFFSSSPRSPENMFAATSESISI